MAQPYPEAARQPGAGRVLAHSALVLIPAAAAATIVVLQLIVVYTGYLYPLRPDAIAAIGHPFTPDPEVLHGAWGGPTLVGAWFIHSCAALGIQLVGAVLLRGLLALLNRTTGRLLG